ncbi:TerC family protein [Siphonobacter aquaeclarae]|uniref:Membrane protein TerC, possibly involved in tellurium resistance n=1 Tax=Siphonobacter aquaeclarae TaxID=563176 RepID=A0A1G9U2Z5_9BACT|nr:TerC family protein [Siphonobacter aquaeclarae]SDM54004.1 Membrane protein TerC, possibly involved in tellurium resistance [Siphonobacter aquaeclarae]
MEFPNLADPAVLISLLTLSFLEIVLGVDNIIFISIIVDKLEAAQQRRARTIGLLLAMVFRICLLFGITSLLKLTSPLFEVPFLHEHGTDNPVGISWKDLILLGGGLFLVGKSTLEIHHKLEDSAAEGTGMAKYSKLSLIIVQIVLVDAVFSIDSILTAVGLVENVWIMIIAVVLSMGVMLAFSGVIADFINRNPTLQILALSFLIAIGIMLVAEAFHQEVSKTYLYTAMAFSLVVELINMRLRRNIDMVKLNEKLPDYADFGEKDDESKS